MKKCSKCLIEKTESDFHRNMGRLRSQCIACRKPMKRDYYLKNREALIKKSINWQKENPIKYKDRIKKWNFKNACKIKKKRAEYFQKNKKFLMDANNKKTSIRIKEDPVFCAKTRFRSRFSNLKRSVGLKSQEVIGCSWEDFKNHIQSKFKDGMHWNNHGKGKGKWHFDHKIPLASCSSIEDILKCFHYTNIQPLWEHENLSKGAKLNWDKDHGAI